MAEFASHVLSPHTQATLLLCGSLGAKRTVEPQPLSLSEYNRLAKRLHSRDMRPGDLLQPGGLEQLGDDQHDFEGSRLAALLARGASLALSVERWTNAGLWVLGRSDPGYPARLKSHLKQQAPVLLYGAGNADLLDRGGLAIVGSREADEEALAFTRRIARRCAAEQTLVISGGARGIDAEAMRAALEDGGQALGVLADSLATATVAKAYREALRRGSLVLCSPYDPAAGFSVGNAMGRNKLLYALSDAALVVTSTAGTGGTWAGAIENQRHKWVPLFVRNGALMSEGNRLLIEHGAHTFDEQKLPESRHLLDWMTGQASAAERAVAVQPALF